MSDDDDDSELFRRKMSDVRPLARARKEPPRRPRPAPRARFRRADDDQVLSESLSGELSDDNYEEFTFSRPGVPRSVMRKLRRGRYSIGDELDLHGQTVATARHALDEFLNEAIAAGYGCVRIIHGKGLGSGRDGPVLKPRVARWLRRRDAVVAYTTARAVDGGSGALYVLLRN